MGETSRVAINLGALIVLAIALAIYGFITWIDQPLFDDRYDLVVTVPDAGGIAPDQAVTVRGVRQGTVEDMRLTPDGVEIRMAMEPDETPATTRSSVPTTGRRSSPIASRWPRSGSRPNRMR
jgi:ABC-type transporter Mla subunit MlaD